ncbi:hypothetical protein A2U01_0079510, partial [Trifolium medium]|nr:hypothetical protein [Trifolium medium]
VQKGKNGVREFER